MSNGGPQLETPQPLRQITSFVRDVAQRLVDGGYLADTNRVTIGVTATFRHRSAPMVRFIPKGGPWSAPQKAYGLDPETKIGTGAGKVAPPRRRIATREMGFEVRCWADGTSDEEAIDNAEELARGVVEAVHAIAHGSYRVEGEGWDTAGDSSAGAVCVILLGVAAPVTLRDEVHRPRSTMPITPKLETP